MIWNLVPPCLSEYSHPERWNNLSLVPSLLSYHFESEYAQPCFECIKMMEYVRMNLFSQISCNNIEFIWWESRIASNQSESMFGREYMFAQLTHTHLWIHSLNVNHIFQWITLLICLFFSFSRFYSIHRTVCKRCKNIHI